VRASRALRVAVWLSEVDNGLPDLGTVDPVREPEGVLVPAPDWYAGRFDPGGGAAWADDAVREDERGIAVRWHPEVLLDAPAAWALDRYRRGTLGGDEDQLSAWQLSAVRVVEAAHRRLVAHLRREATRKG
jgi:hypothetical protein